MSVETLETTLHWAGSLLADETNNKFEVIFHGGEPLVAGAPFFRQALPLLRQTFANKRLRLSLQSNLWLLTDELCDLFTEYNVSLGTSLDGPESITDAQRGSGYFRRTMAGIELARHHGLGVGCICTFTRQSVLHTDAIVEFFIREGLDVTVHGAVPPLVTSHSNQSQEKASDEWSLSPQDHGELLVYLLNSYLGKLSRIRIPTLDSLCRSVSAGKGGVCTFGDCLGDYLAVAPDGGIYPCQRFVGHPKFCLGQVQNLPNHSQLEQSPVWQLFRQREQQVVQECGECSFFPFCKGGCPYDALAAGGGVFQNLRDPYCSAYQRIYSHITDQALEEVFSDKNLDAVINEPANGTLLRHGPLLNLMRGGPHPRDVAKRAQRILAAVALGSNEPLSVTAQRLVQAGLAQSTQQAEASLATLKRNLSIQGQLNNLYLHVTFGCNLHCEHCYASASPDRLRADIMSSEQIISSCREAAALGFRQTIITGGEPLTHPERDKLLHELSALRATIKPMLLVLRTNLALTMSPELLLTLGKSVDKIAVSVDGDQISHDARRGIGSYERTVSNLHTLINVGCEAELSLTAILSAANAISAPGESVRALARELGNIRVQFRPILPLGRARQSQLEIVRESHLAYLNSNDAITYGFSPQATCGIGQNLYVEPNGKAFPCYAWNSNESLLGTLDSNGSLERIVKSPMFISLSQHTVDSNQQCRNCALRYLCSGACRAWSGPLTKDLDAPPVNCSPLHERARSLLLEALRHLEISHQQWTAAGLPLPESPTVI